MNECGGDVFKKGLAIECKRQEYGCNEKMEKVGMNECGGDALAQWNQAECEGAVTEVCCPWAETLVGCMDKKCVQLDTAMTKVGSDNGDPGAKKELESSFKTAAVCPGLGLPKNEAEAEAILASSVSDDAPPATSFAFHEAP